MLDDRLPNQILDAIFAFGLSVLVLDKNYSRRAAALKFLASTIICYKGVDDRFEVVSKFDRVVSAATFGIQKRALARILGDTGNRVHRHLTTIQRIIQKLAFNQLYFENLGLTDTEMQFPKTISEIDAQSEGRKKLSNLIKETSNTRFTDYF